MFNTFRIFLKTKLKVVFFLPVFSIICVLFLCLGEGPFQGVIDMFGGSGGLIEFRAALLASRGFAALALAYFNYKDLPDITFLDHGQPYDYFEVCG